jgi:uncharacterized protein YtpQ (UPF0354 family)
VTPQQYQHHVLGLLEATFRDEKFEGSPDPLVISHGEAQLGLQNLYAVYTKEHLAPEERDTHIREHFWRILEAVGAKDAATATWDEGRPRVRVQFIRSAYASRFPVITYPFAGEIVIAVAIDRPHAYSYVSPQDLERWGVTRDSLYQEAIANLQEASAGIQLHATEAPERIMAIQTGDGYDAARLMLPAMRELAIDHLGEPYYAAIPNRDFIIMWSSSNSEEFQGLVRKQVLLDFESQPYPLTSAVFVVTDAEVKVKMNDGPPADSPVGADL